MAWAAVVILCSRPSFAFDPSDPPAGAPEDRSQAERESRQALKTGDFDAPTIGWREGPVRYLLSKDEDEAFRHLATREERLRFIQRFWAQRDPAPTTPDNEYRTLFYRRVEEAQRLFTTESTKPGWKTDRGKIFILLGPPDDLDQGSTRRQAPEIITWTYRDPPPGTGASPNSQVRFVRDPSGEYRLSSGIRLFSSETAMSVALSLQALQVKSLPDMRPVPDMPATAPEEGGGTDSGASPVEAAGALRTLAQFFRSAGGRTLVVLTLWAPERSLEDGTAAGGSPLEATARLDPERPGGESATGVTTLLPAPAGSPRDSEGTLVFQGGVVTRPGPYTATFTLARHGDAVVHSARSTIAVPGFADDTLAVGHIAFAARLEHHNDNPWPEYTAPFVFGHLEIVPRTDDLFRQGEDLKFYYQVLNGSTDPVEGLPDLDLEYRFLVRSSGPDGGRSFLAFGNPIHLTHAQSLIQGFSLPLTDWSPGFYRLEVLVTDNLTGGTAVGRASFQVQ